LAERLWSWRKNQNMIRPLLLQDLVWFGFNGYLLGLVAGPLFSAITQWVSAGFNAVSPIPLFRIQVLKGLPLWVEIPLFLVVIDFVEWGVHNLLHRNGWLWKIHRVHHSIHTMDWIGNFRFHPVEIFVYHLFKVIPLGLLGASTTGAVATGMFAMLIGNLNHANLNLSWGPLRYVLNSPCMHLWHHEAKLRNRAGTNFGIVLSLWDWLFKTAYMPKGKVPERIGFKGDEHFPESLFWRLFLPFLDARQKGPSQR